MRQEITAEELECRPDVVEELLPLFDLVGGPVYDLQTAWRPNHYKCAVADILDRSALLDEPDRTRAWELFMSSEGERIGEQASTKAFVAKMRAYLDADVYKWPNDYFGIEWP